MSVLDETADSRYVQQTLSLIISVTAIGVVDLANSTLLLVMQLGMAA